MISLDTECTGLDIRHGARPFLITTGDEDGNNQWWTWRVDPLTRKVNVVKEEFVEFLDLLVDAHTVVLQNPKFDYHALRMMASDLQLMPYFVEAWDWGKIRDTLLAGHLLASNQPHDLTTMVLVYLGVNIKPLEDKLVEACKEARRIAKSEFPDWRIAKEGLPEMPSAKASVTKFDMWLPYEIARKLKYVPDHPWYTVCEEYANGDSASTLPLYLKQETLLKERGLWEIYLERLKVLPVIAGMEETGITYSIPRSISSRRDYQKASDEAAETCREIAESYGVELELPKSGNNNSLRSFIFETLKLPVVSRSERTGEPSLDKSVMEHYRTTLKENSVGHTFIEALMSKRKRDTAISYLEGYERYALPYVRGFYKLYSSVNPTGSDTLRMSSSNPNQQNIGKQEDEFSHASFNLRRAFGPAPGREWYSIDYENLELKIPAYESGEQIMIDVFERPNEGPFWGSYHLLNASIVYPDLFWPIAEEKGKFKELYKSTYYQWIKNFGFSVQYGAQEATADAAARRKGAYAAIKSKMPNIERLNQSCIKHAEKHGYVETIPDREINPTRGYPLLCRRSSWGSISPTLPLNYRIQGTACWIMMRAMIKVQEYLDRHPEFDAKIIMNVHDELVFDFPKGGPRTTNLPRIKKIRNIMASVGDCVGVPLTCGVTFHPEDWSTGLAI